VGFQGAFLTIQGKEQALKRHFEGKPTVELTLLRREKMAPKRCFGKKTKRKRIRLNSYEKKPRMRR